MKAVEEAFASAGFRRVIMPGIVLTTGIHPILSNWITPIATAYSVVPTVFLIAEIIFFGLVISSGIQWIYYVYEGFRLPLLTIFAAWINKRRLSQVQGRYHQIQGDRDYDQLTEREKNKILRLYEYLCDFPVRPGVRTSERYVERPTRIGNIIATYELYANTRYGIDGVYYWHHLLNLAPDSARKHFEEDYAFAESLLLTSFAGAIVSTIHMAMLIGFGIGSSGFVLVKLYIGPTLSVVLAIFGVSSWLFFYRAALPAHRAAGTAFRAIVDSVMSKFVDWAKTAEAPVGQDARAKIKAMTESADALFCTDSKKKRSRG